MNDPVVMFCPRHEEVYTSGGSCRPCADGRPALSRLRARRERAFDAWRLLRHASDLGVAERAWFWLRAWDAAYHAHAWRPSATS